MRVVACVNMILSANPSGYFKLDDDRIIHESSIPILKAHGVLENVDDVEVLKGEFYREQAYSVQGAEAIAILSSDTIYKVLEGDGIVAGREFSETYFEIPDGIKFIGKGGFQGIQSLQTVVIPGSVQVIEDDAFNGCRNLTKVVLKNGIKTIKSRAFANTSLGMNTLSIPDSVETISMKSAFPACAKIAFVGDDLSSSCRRALTHCGLSVRRRQRY